jgi:hypothetical protein
VTGCLKNFYQSAGTGIANGVCTACDGTIFSDGDGDGANGALAAAAFGSSVTTCQCSNGYTGAACDKATCESIAAAGPMAMDAFCVDNGASGLKSNPGSISCAASTCNKNDDAGNCCKATMCDSIAAAGPSATNAFCADNGANGLVNNAGSVACAASICNKNDDAGTCCSNQGSNSNPNELCFTPSHFKSSSASFDFRGQTYASCTAAVNSIRAVTGLTFGDSSACPAADSGEADLLTGLAALCCAENSGNGRSFCYTAPAGGETSNAMCDSIAAAGTSAMDAFCADNGANGLVNNAGSISCAASPCNKNVDAGNCCRAGGGGTSNAMCDSIAAAGPSARDAFCVDNGANGLVNHAGSISCAASSCNKNDDAGTCCSNPKELCFTPSYFKNSSASFDFAGQTFASCTAAVNFIRVATGLTLGDTLACPAAGSNEANVLAGLAALCCAENSGNGRSFCYTAPADNSYVCKTPADYQGDNTINAQVIGGPEAPDAQWTCDSIVGQALQGLDFSTTYDCSQAADHIKNAIERIASNGCCGTNGQSTCSAAPSVTTASALVGSAENSTSTDVVVGSATSSTIASFVGLVVAVAVTSLVH